METPELLSLKQNGLVEVSGWDEDEIFFVERSELDWDELFACKHVTLTHMLSEGSIILVPPIPYTATHRANPIPYEAEFVGCSPEGHHKFRLNGVQPPYGRENFSVN